MREKHPAQYCVKNHSLWVQPNGDLDHHNVSRISARIDALIDECEIERLVFDFSKVEFMDSSGIGMIMGRYRRLLLHGGKLYAVGASAPVKKILKYSGLYQILEALENGNGEERECWENKK